MLTERANAKINLYLDVVGRMENGYHEIESVMQSVSLCDLVSLDFRPGNHTSIHLQTDGSPDLPNDCRNLAFRAAELFLTASDRRGSVEIMLQKRIPTAAGLAGGSADAAAVLRGMNRLCGSPYSPGELENLGARLGADVPFCVLGGCALCRGIGEKTEPLPTLSAAYIVVAVRGEGVSTPWAYQKLDGEYDGFRTRSEHSAAESILTALRSNAHAKTVADYCYNIFEKPVASVHPDVTPIKETMKNCGAYLAMMSGSGPSVFGLFESEDDATRACTLLTDSGSAAFVCLPTGKNKF